MFDRRYLREISNVGENHPDFKRVYEALVSVIYQKKQLSLAEENFTCRILSNCYSENNVPIDIFEFENCSNYIFRHLYLIYFNDLNGYKRVFDHKGEISIDHKKHHVRYLDECFKKWKPLVEEYTNGQSIINFVSRELKYHLRYLNIYATKLGIGANFKSYLEKSIYLHSKYIFLLVSEFFEGVQNNRVVFDYNGKNVIVDGFSYAHILSRHYGKVLKDHLIGKSFHEDEEIDVFNIPYFILDVIEDLHQSPNQIDFLPNDLIFEFKGRRYIISFRPIKIAEKGKGQSTFYRIQTFFPCKYDVEEMYKGKRFVFYSVKKTA